MPPYELREIVPGLHVADASQRFFGLEMGARMTVLELDGGLLVHSPVAVDPASVSHLGTPRWVIAPNLLHHLHLSPWVEAGLEAWAAPGLPEKRRDIEFRGVLGADLHPFGGDLRLFPLESFPFTNEVVALHRPSRTLIVTDLVFNIARTAPWLTRAAMRLLRGYPGCRTTLIERLGMRRSLARQELASIVDWDFDRVIMAHGEVIETGAKQALIDAFSWLALPAPALQGR